MRPLHLVASLACAAAASLGGAAAQAKAEAAEFAIRWDPAAGGPRTPEEVVQALGLRDLRTRQFVVRYFMVSPPAGTPEGSTAIARERQVDARVVSMYKLRRDSPLPAAGVTGWRCPFTVDAKREREIDIGWSAEGRPLRTYSMSCEADGPLAALLPAGYAATPRGCSSEVLRLSAKRIKVERWKLPDGTQALEVSSNGRDTEAQREAFAARVVRPLLALGAQPLAQSKTQLGHCP